MPNPDIKAALNRVTTAHDKCLLLRHVLKNTDGVTLDGAMLRGLGNVFDDLLFDLESIKGDLEPE